MVSPVVLDHIGFPKLGNALLLAYWAAQCHELSMRKFRVDPNPFEALFKSHHMLRIREDEARELRDVLSYAGVLSDLIDGQYQPSGNYKPETFSSIDARLTSLMNSREEIAQISLVELVLPEQMPWRFNTLANFRSTPQKCRELLGPIARRGVDDWIRSFRELTISYFNGECDPETLDLQPETTPPVVALDLPENAPVHYDAPFVAEGVRLVQNGECVGANEAAKRIVDRHGVLPSLKWSKDSGKVKGASDAAATDRLQRSISAALKKDT